MFSLSVVVCGILAVTAATEVNQCSGGSYEGLSDAVQLVPCKKLPCKLKKGTDEHITVEFTPENDLNDLVNKVTANVYGVDLPFVGVDGKSIRDKIETEDGQKAPFPLKGGTKYLYKDSFPVLSFYPSIEVQVHWALNSGDKEVICFEVPAKIVG